ncbi:YARHG domain-containing protein [Clostridium sp.]
MKNISYIKFKLLNILILALFIVSFVGCNSAKNTSLNNTAMEKSICAQITESTVITFPDKNLEKIIREKIESPTGDILKDDVSKITDLPNAGYKHIKNLSGIENLTNLTSLNLSDNQISNIKPLEGLTNLTSLDLAVNEISNIEPLKGLINLTKLDLDTNRIKDYSPVFAYYKNLKRTDIASAVIIPKQEESNINDEVTMSTTITPKQEIKSDNNQVAESTDIMPKQEAISNSNDNEVSTNIIPNQEVKNDNNQVTKSTDLITKQKAISNSNDDEVSTTIIPNQEIKSDTDFILPNSSTEKLKESDLGNLTDQQLMIARNEVYARYGFVFNTQAIKNFFESKSWYHPRLSYNCNINSIESFNVQLIKKTEEDNKQT